MSDVLEIGSEVIDAVAEKVLAQMPKTASADEIADAIATKQAVREEEAEALAKKNIHEDTTAK